MNLTQCLTRSLTKGAILFAFIAVWMITTWFGTQWVKGTDEEVMGIRDHAAGSPAYVIEHNNCVEHKSSGPLDFPTGVVYQGKDGRAHYSASDLLITKALDDVLGGKDWPSHIVVMFCE